MDPNLAALLGIALLALLAFLASQRDRQPRRSDVQVNCAGRCHCLSSAHIDAIGAGAANAKADAALEATLRLSNAYGHVRGLQQAQGAQLLDHDTQLRHHNTRLGMLFNVGGNVFSWVPILIGAAIGFAGWLIARIVITVQAFDANGLNNRQFRLSEVWNLHSYSAIILVLSVLGGAAFGAIFAFRRDNANQQAAQQQPGYADR